MPDFQDNLNTRNLRTIFLDRDGVLNEKMPEGMWVTSPAEFRLLPGVAEAVARLNRAGRRVIVVSNQRGVALGKFTIEDVEAIHEVLQNLLRTKGGHVDAFFFCPHERGLCKCRKPLTGMFDQAKERFPEIDAATSAMIGDSLSDVEFGQQLGMLTVFLEGDPERQKAGAGEAAERADQCFRSLSSAVDYLLANR